MSFQKVYQKNMNMYLSKGRNHALLLYVSEFMFYIQLVKLGYTKFIEINVTNDYHGEVEKIL